LQAIEHAEKDIDIFLSHPINQYRLISRMSTDWPIIYETIEKSSKGEKTTVKELGLL